MSHPATSHLFYKGLLPPSQACSLWVGEPSGTHYPTRTLFLHLLLMLRLIDFMLSSVPSPRALSSAIVSSLPWDKAWHTAGVLSGSHLPRPGQAAHRQPITSDPHSLAQKVGPACGGGWPDSVGSLHSKTAVQEAWELPILPFCSVVVLAVKWYPSIRLASRDSYREYHQRRDSRGRPTKPTGVRSSHTRCLA